MNSVLYQAISGFFWVVTFFIISYLLVVGGKIVYFAILEILTKNREPINSPVEKPKKPKRQKETQKAPQKPIRSIEINPDEVDRIRFKKSS